MLLDIISFWCHEDSCLIHPVGWALRVGHEISAPPEYLERCAAGKFPTEAAPKEFFRVPPNLHTSSSVDFKEGMMLETMDPLNPSSICVATVKKANLSFSEVRCYLPRRVEAMKVLKEGYLMIRVDSFEPYANRGDWFCFHKSSPLLFPAGYCDVNNIPLCPPLSHAHQEFCWETYLQETNASTAPLELFTRDFPAHGFVEGMHLEAAEVMEPGRICVATVTRVAGRMIKIHFDGWDDEFDQWLDYESPDMYPVGWCQLVGHRLEPARQPDEDKAAKLDGSSELGVPDDQVCLLATEPLIVQDGFPPGRIPVNISVTNNLAGRGLLYEPLQAGGLECWWPSQATGLHKLLAGEYCLHKQQAGVRAVLQAEERRESLCRLGRAREPLWLARPASLLEPGAGPSYILKKHLISNPSGCRGSEARPKAYEETRSALCRQTVECASSTYARKAGGTGPLAELRYE
ncbi:hypothetical protein PR048_001545 [Dryococelus australis]|uniref:Uncharacterized protein n=1 Tax=Dryococelus australis TaxID=614101 RepID=A0ABQ9IHR0_9NEOP|nr:hypothetical protein PR048_001545 [Dryococelus australis]